VVKRAVREDTPNPDFVLKAYIKTLFDEEMKTRRFRPPLPKRAASVPERAKQVGLGESTLEGEIREGRLEAIKVRSRTLVTDEAFDRWLATRERIKPKREAVRQRDPETLELT
jgi:excisionase family DNA binding protein